MSRYYIVSTIFLVLLIGALALDGTLRIPSYFYVGLMGMYLIITIIGSFVLSLQYYFPVRYHGANVNSIAITFDDGPLPGKTENILSVLNQFQVSAAFFCIGHRVDQHPALVKRIHDDGHLLGNHSYLHKSSFPFQSSAMIHKELVDTDIAIQKITGQRPRFFRPPFGVSNPMIAKSVRRRNAVVAGWSVRSYDTVTHDPEKLLRRITRTLKGGDIVLFHDYPDVTAKVLPRFLEQVDKLGLKVVRLDKLLNEKGYA